MICFASFNNRFAIYNNEFATLNNILSKMINDFAGCNNGFAKFTHGKGICFSDMGGSADVNGKREAGLALRAYKKMTNNDASTSLSMTIVQGICFFIVQK